MRKLLDLLFLSLLAALNLLIVFPLFQGEYNKYIFSVEMQYYSHIKFITENFPNIWWQPFWYTGFPFYLFYQPILPFALSIAKFISGLSIPKVYRISIALFYILGSMSVYVLIRDWTKKSLSAFIASIVYSIGPSITAFIPVVVNQEKDINFLSWRLVVLAMYGEGAHIWGLAIIPISLLFFRRLLHNQNRINWVFTVLSIVLILLTSITAFMPLLVLLFIVWMIEFFKKSSSIYFFIFLLVLLFSYGLGAFWYNYSFISVMFGFAKSGAGGISGTIFNNLLLACIIIIFFAAIFLFIIESVIKKKEGADVWFISLISFIVIFATVYERYCCNIGLLPLPLDYLPRFGPEVELVFVVFLGVSLAGIETKIYRLLGKIKILGSVVFLLIAVLLIIVSQTRIDQAHKLTYPNENVASSSEYVISKWLKQNDSNKSRIFATGTHGQWLYYWSDLPELRGVADQAIVNPLWNDVIYQIYWGESGQLAVNWLKAIGIKYIVVNSSESSVAYKDFTHPEKFKNLAKQVFSYNGDIVYLLTTTKTGLVYMVNPGILEKIGSINSVLDKKGLSNYVFATEDNPDFKEVNYVYKKPWDELTIKPDQRIADSELLVRITYHPGWRAYQGNSGIEITRDPIGFMILHPKDNEIIRLSFSPTIDVYFGYILSIVSLVLFIIFIVKNKYLFNRVKKDLNPPDEDY